MIYDCRRKERLIIERRSGDLEIRVEDLSGKILYQGWYEMKKPHKRTFNKALLLFNTLQSLLKQE